MHEKFPVNIFNDKRDLNEFGKRLKTPKRRTRRRRMPVAREADDAHRASKKGVGETEI